jgi:uncharacterized protein YbaP (TraB family)
MACRAFTAPCLAYTPGVATPGVATPGVATPQIDEVVVTGERAGPNMWHVHQGAANLWILGSMSPLPHDITWRSRQVEHVLGTTHQVLVQEPFEIGVPRILWTFLTKRDLLMVRGGKRLAEVMRPDLYRRFTVQRAQVTDDAKKWERYRPIIAAALLQHEVFRKVHLSVRLDLGAALRSMAKQRGIRLEEVQTVRFADMLDTLKTLPQSTEDTCVNASLATMESGLPRLVARAQAWADGNIGRLEGLAEPQEVNDCRNALDASQGATTMIARLREAWMASMEKYLANGTNTIAVVNLDMVLEQGGLLDELRRKGYQIDAPDGTSP